MGHGPDVKIFVTVSNTVIRDGQIFGATKILWTFGEHSSKKPKLQVCLIGW
jgi:hypothetical protein